MIWLDQPVHPHQQPHLHQPPPRERAIALAQHRLHGRTQFDEDTGGADQCGAQRQPRS